MNHEYSAAAHDFVRHGTHDCIASPNKKRGNCLFCRIEQHELPPSGGDLGSDFLESCKTGVNEEHTHVLTLLISCFTWTSFKGLRGASSGVACGAGCGDNIAITGRLQSERDGWSRMLLSIVKLVPPSPLSITLSVLLLCLGIQGGDENISNDFGAALHSLLALAWKVSHACDLNTSRCTKLFEPYRTDPPLLSHLQVSSSVLIPGSAKIIMLFFQALEVSSAQRCCRAIHGAHLLRIKIFVSRQGDGNTSLGCPTSHLRIGCRDCVTFLRSCALPW
jgi:hypothetical protein